MSAEDELKSDTSGPKSAFNGVWPNPHFPSNPPNGHAIFQQPLCGLNIPCERLVDFGVLGRSDNHQVLKPIVESVTIDVMDVLKAGQLPANKCLHGDTMLLNLDPIDSLDTVAPPINPACILVVPITNTTTESQIVIEGAGISSDISAAIGAGTSNHAISYELTPAGEQATFLGNKPSVKIQYAQSRLDKLSRGTRLPMQDAGLFGDPASRADLFE